MNLPLFTIAAIASIISLSTSDHIRKPAHAYCDKQETLFKHRTEYTYRYTVDTASSFVGATDSMAGSQITCTVTIKVARKCELTMQLSQCALKKTSPGSTDELEEVDNSDMFAQELQRYPLYFQMLRGIIQSDRIVAEEDDTRLALNIKRGILSALQFRIMHAGHYSQQLEQTDIFGTCKTKYTFAEDTPNTMTTYRDLRECTLRQIFKKQFTHPFVPVRRETGGELDGPISEGIYPFVSEVTCDYRMNDDMRLQSVNCRQQQYFKPLAYHGDILASAMTNITTTMELMSAVSRALPRFDLSLDGRKLVDIRFDHGIDEETQQMPIPDDEGQAQLQTTLHSLSQQYTVPGVSGSVPETFGQLVLLMRRVSRPALHKVMTSVFNSDTEGPMRTFYLDGLMSCGTDPCILSFLHCITMGHVGKFDEQMFLNGLAQGQPVSERVMEKLWEYCLTTDSTGCWLPLSTLLGKIPLDDVKELPLSSTLGKVLTHMADILDHTINDTYTIRQRITAIKMGSNIGGHRVDIFITKHPSIKYFLPRAIQCLSNNMCPVPVKKAVIQAIIVVQEEYEYSDRLKAVRHSLFMILYDVNADMTLRTMAFSFLMKTTDTAVITRLIKHMQSPDITETSLPQKEKTAPETRQFRAYMSSAIQALIENDEPGLKQVREAWETAGKSESIPKYFSEFNRHHLGMSKSINVLHLLKVPSTEYFGGQLLMDLVYDPSAVVFSHLSLGLNYYYENEKYNIFHMTLDVHGFDLLLNTLLKRSNIPLMHLFGLYKKAQQQADDGGSRFESTAKFQKDIVDAITKILEQVNHPTFPKFDVNFDLKIRGHNTMFVSLQEVMSFWRAMTSAGHPEHGSFMKRHLVKLMKGIRKTPFKSVEFASLRKILPTIAGVPLNMTVQVLGTNRVDVTVQSNAMLFMAKRTPLLSGVFNHFISFDTVGGGEMVIPIGQYHSSGLKMVVSLGSERSVDTKLTLGVPEGTTPHGQRLPALKRLQFDMSPISDGKDSENFISSRGRMFILHGSTRYEILGDPAVEKTVTKCLPDDKAALVGRSICLHLTYPNVTTSKSHAYFPLSGPYDFALKMTKHNNAGFDSFIFEYALEKTDGGMVDHVYFSRIGDNDPQSRALFADVTYYRSDYHADVEINYPDTGYMYKGVYRNTGNAGRHIYQLAEDVSVNGKSIIGYIIKSWRNRDTKDGRTETTSGVELGRTLPHLSQNLAMERTQVSEGSDIVFNHINATYTFHCAQDNPFMYMFHLLPTEALRNGDTTRVTVDVTQKYVITTPRDWTEEFTFTLGYYDRTLTLVGNVVQDDAKMTCDITGTHVIGDQQQHYTISEVIMNRSTKQGLDIEANVDITSDDFNIVITGDVKGPTRNVQVNGDIHYVNTVENNSRRKKRSLSSIYKRFVELEGKAVTKLEELKKAVMGVDDATKETEPVNKPEVQTETDASPPVAARPKLPNMIPTFPSIFDRKEWSANVKIGSRMKPVFAPSSPGRPVGVEVISSLYLHAPWSGGFTTVQRQQVFGRHIKSSFRNFKYWMRQSQNVTYTSAEGDVITDEDGNALVWVQDVDGVISREAGKNFHFEYNHKQARFQLTYLIHFDWEAASHHEPLIHVLSQQTNQDFPFLTYKYEEFTSYELGHVKHTLRFHHQIMDLATDTDINFVTERVYQNGSLSFSAPKKSYDFINKIGKGWLTSEVVSSSGIERKYKFKMNDPKSLTISAFIKSTHDTKYTPLWTYNIQAVGAHTREVTITWSFYTAYTLTKPAKRMVFSIGMKLNDVANHIHANLDKPHGDRTFLFTKTSINSLVKKHVLPNLLMWYSRVASNFISLKHRRRILDSPGPKVLPRIAIFFAGVRKRAVKSEQDPLPIRAIHRLGYYTVKGLSLLTLTARAKLGRTDFFHKQELKFGWTVPYTGFFVLIPDPLDSMRHLTGPMQQLLGYYRNRYSDRTYIGRNVPVGLIMGRRDTARDLHVRTYDGWQFDIPGDVSQQCTYLLTADAKRSLFSVVSSPAGITLVTEGTTVTIGYDKRVYLNDCKQPVSMTRLQTDKHDVTVEQTDVTITVQTQFGLTLTCSRRDVDVCSVQLSPAYFNRTIGLFGTNDGAPFTDRRGIDGTVIPDVDGFLREFTVGDAGSCQSSSSTDTASTCPKQNMLQECNKHALKLWPPHIGWDTVKDICYRETSRCGSTEKDLCYVYEAMTWFYKQPATSVNLTLPAPCSAPLPAPVDTVSTGFLDVVFVVSKHMSMMKYNKQPWEYAKQIMTHTPREWLKFTEVRIGVVGFGGDVLHNEYFPFVIKQENGIRDFTEQTSFDWDQPSASLLASGTEQSDAFQAIDVAAKMPFKPTAHKLIIVFMTKEQGKRSTVDVDALREKLSDQDIVLNVFSTYAKLASRKVVGIDWDKDVISRKKGYVDTKDLPKTGYADLIVATKGTLWDLRALGGGHISKVGTVVGHLLKQTTDSESCPAS